MPRARLKLGFNFFPQFRRWCLAGDRIHQGAEFTLPLVNGFSQFGIALQVGLITLSCGTAHGAEDIFSSQQVVKFLYPVLHAQRPIGLYRGVYLGN